ncbi:MAG: hypothetical protein RQ751_03605 [Longimicrobiales bacterium]|nr:hypothetical protein [Longimicrobiales bacterium]
MTARRTGPPEEALRAGEETVREGLASLEAGVGAALDRLEQSLSGNAAEPLDRALAAARDAHRALVREAGLAPDPAREAGCAARPRALAAYREGVARDVVGPLLRTLERHPPPTAVEAAWEGFLREVEARAAALPERVLRAEPADLFVRLPGDGAWTRLVKGWVRAGRGVTGIFRRRGARPQEVALRALALRHLRSGAMPGAVDLAVSLQRRHARAAGALEEAVGRWLCDWFPLEDAAHPPAGHLSPDASEALAALRGRLDPMLRELGLVEEEAAEGEGEAAADGDDGGDSAGDGGGDPDGDRGGSVAGTGAAGTGDGGTPRTTPEEGAGATPAEVAHALQRALDDLVEGREAAATDGTPREEAARTAERALLRVRAAARVSGTSLATRPPRGEADRLVRLRARMERQAELWRQWHEAAAGRLRLAAAVLDFRATVDQTLTRMYDEVLARAVLEPGERLAAGRDALLGLRDATPGPESPSGGGSAPEPEDARAAMAAEVEALLTRARAALEAEVLEPLAPDALQAEVRRAADRAAEALADALRSLPERIEVHALRAAGAGTAPDPERPTRRVTPQEAARQALDALQLESLRISVAPLLDALREAGAACAGVPGVVEYNLETARSELLAEEPDTVLEDARILVVQGLERSARALEQVSAELLPPYDEFGVRAHGVIHRALTQAHERLTAEGAVQEQIRDLRSRLQARAQELLRWGGTRWVAVRRRLSHLMGRGRVRILRLVRRGRAALVAEAAQEGEAERALEVIRSVPALLEPLPLVYRRLFAFQPVSDPALLVGREEEKAWVSRRFNAWAEGVHVPSVLVGPLTVGHTSLFNVLAASLFREARMVRLTFPDRCRTLEAVAERVHAVLAEAGVMEAAGDGASLERLARALLDAPRAADGAPDPPPPLVVLTEGLSHLFLRIPGGAAPLERFLEFQARTSPAVFWLSGASRPLWKLLEKLEPRATALVTTGPVSTLERDDLEAALMVRHQRSGVPLEFLAPEDANPLLRRRLRRANDEPAREALLREEYFDRLFRASQGNVAMAILLWLKSADFSAQEGWLQLRPPRPLSFGFLEALDLGLDFALKAFLEHGSLTLEEYTAVFAVPEDDAYQALEALRGRSLLERLDAAGGIPRPAACIESGVRYRIPPLLSQVVSRYLQNHNILH